MSSSGTSITALIERARTVAGIPPTTYLVPYANIRELLEQQTAIYGDKTWLIFYSDEQPGEPVRYSYKEFRHLVAQSANYLLSRGLQAGDAIATVAANHADTVIQYFAAWSIGAIVVPINVGEDDRRIGYILQNAGVRLAFVNEAYIDRMEHILKEIPEAPAIVVTGRPLPGRVPASDAGASSHRYPEFHDVIRGREPSVAAGPVISPEQEALIVYTSGTTGNPKGVVLTQYNLLVDAMHIAAWHGMTPDQRMMCVLPLHHVNGTVVTLMTPLYYGGSVVLNQKFHSHKFFERIAAERVHVVSVVPTLLQFLLHEQPAMSRYDLAHFRHIICGAGPLTVDLAIRFEDHFHIPIMHGYGLSETTCYSCFLPIGLSPDEHRSWLKESGFPSIGVPIPSNEMAIHDDQGRELPELAKGEIVIRGHNVMKEYHANPAANAATFAFGWFRSGDEGFYKLDAGGRRFFFITGRIKELIIRGGSNISPFEIDEVLMNMPGVQAGLAVGFENDWYGEEVGAYVKPKEGVTLTENDVLEYCRRHFPFQKSPKVVVFGNDIPVTSTGKYQRGKLRPLFAKWKGTQFR